MKKLFIALLLSLTAITSHAETYQFRLNLDPETIEIGKSLPKPKAIGQLKLANGVSLPAYQVYFTAGYSDKAYETTNPDTLTLAKSLDKKWQNELVAYSFDGRWIVMPKNW